ncbi:hypothetical protein WJX79_003974 [Trebouxia sp. C0005]
MLTDAFEKPRAGVNLSDTISDKLKDYPAASSSSKSRSVIPKCFRPSTSETSPSKADLRRQLKDAQLQYEQLTYQNQHAETALSGSISETLRFDHAKRLAEAQAAQAKQELQKLQTSLQASESRAADAGQQVQREIQVLRNRVRGLTSQTQKVSSRLQIVEGGSVARLMDAAWEVTIPAAIVQRVYDMAKRNHDTIIYESFSEGFINSQEGEPSHDPHGQNPMLGKAFKMEE